MFDKRVAIVPIPNLQIDEISIMFDMEVANSPRLEDIRRMYTEDEWKPMRTPGFMGGGQV